MSLGEYARKRKFGRTPEPGPEGGEEGSGRRYCVQRHLARRLHFDLRLEVAGTLKSWAVPQGPTLDPGLKRLAVMVEDHPLGYAGFEGNIPKGNYGAGSVMLWDEGSWEPMGEGSAGEQLERGDFKFRIHGKKLAGAFALVRMKNRGKGNEWLLIKKKDEAARAGWDANDHAYSVATGRTQDEIAAGLPARAAGDAAPRLPAPPAPMLAIGSPGLPVGEDWVYEVKWDGVRAVASVEGGRTRLVSRKGTSIDAQYPELSLLHHHVRAREAMLDGEIAVLDGEGRPSFAMIQPRILASDAGQIARLARTHPAVYFAFDLLWLDGRDLAGEPLLERKRLLESVLQPGAALRYSEHFASGGAELLELARAKGLEGVVAKRGSSRYTGGRSGDWVKVKVHHQQEFVICGYTEGERDFFGALVLGIHDAGGLRWAGNVGTGFDRKQMQAIHLRMEALRAPAAPFEEAAGLPKQVRWVRPEQVCSVRYHSWTPEGRLRAPVFQGLRDDVEARECVRSQEGAAEAGRALLEGGKAEASVEVEGRKLRLRNLDKVFYPREGYTKRDLLNFYDAVAEWLIPHWRDRPLSLRRYPDGIGKEGFFQKRADIGGMPDWVRTETVEEGGKLRRMVVGAGRAELLYLANLGCIDQNPWMSRVGTLDKPDWVLIDLDAHECGFDRIVEAAQRVREKLELLGLEGFPKTTGGDGMHIYVPLEPLYSYEMTRSFAEILARLCGAGHPELFTTPRSVAHREKGKVYFDYLQNGMGKTISAPYVARAYPVAPVATPLDWSEVRQGLDPGQFHLRNAVARFERKGDLFRGVLERRQRLEPALERLEELVASGAAAPPAPLDTRRRGS